ncbi:MAG TPA: TonB-dependent receptor [Myxococcales bacterium]|nr:TonB-dependent receptor [Myxococcales bacterium]
MASVALTGAAMGQTPPADQTQNQTPPAQTGQANPVAAPPPANATQDATPGPDTGRKTAQEEIVVTGSRVRRKDLTTPAPVTVISREQITSSAVATIGEFLQQQPEQGGALNTNVNNGGDGETQINLRNLGAQRTLVLVDGKRFVLGGVGAGTAVDLNSIPTAAVERIEILKDGGSAVYGSDAIAGVVNIITRKRMDGVELNGYSGVSGHGDANVYDLNVLAGSQSDKGSFMFGAGYFDQHHFFASARDWAANALSWDFTAKQEGLSGSGTLPKVRVNGLDPRAATCTTKLCADMAAAFAPQLAAAGPGKGLNFIYDPTQSKAGATYVDGWRLRDANLDFYNYQAVNYLVTPSTRISLFGNGEYRMADFARAYFQASYVQRQSTYLVAPEPFVTTGNPDLAVSASNPYNPFGQTLTSVQRRLTDISGRGGGFDVDTLRIVTGIDGTLGEFAGPATGWFWDASINYGRTYGTFTNTGFLNTQKTGPGLGPGFIDSTGAHCGTPKSVIDNCTPINLFGAPGTIDQAMAAQLGAYTGTNTGVNQLFVAAANLSGELFKVASDRPAALAIGFEHRNEYGTFVNQPILAAGWDSDTGSPGPSDTRGGFYVNEGYGELVVPLISHVPFAEEIEVSAAARAFKYNTFGSDWTYKLGARWSPVRDVTVRGTYSTAFRAPNILELFLGQTGGFFESSNDPCANTHGDAALAARCNAAPGGAGGPNVGNNGVTVAQINSVVGGNPALQPEKAKIGTVGIVFEPQVVRGLTMTADFYTISMSNLISAYGTQLILNKCYGAAGVTQDTAFCSLVSRDGPTGAVNRVIDTNTNVGALLTNGIDLAAQYSLPTDIGRFVFRFNSTYLLTYDYTDPTGLVIHGAGNYDGQGTVIASGSTNFNPRVKFNAGVNYSLAGFSAGAVAHFIGPLTECSPAGGVVAGSNTGPGFCYQQSRPDDSAPIGPGNEPYPSHRVSPQVTVDVLLAYRLASPIGATTLALGVRNLFDQAPPRLYDSFLSYADPNYDFIGRYFYGRVEHKF